MIPYISQEKPRLGKSIDGKIISGLPRAVGVGGEWRVAADGNGDFFSFCWGQSVLKLECGNGYITLWLYQNTVKDQPSMGELHIKWPYLNKAIFKRGKTAAVVFIIENLISYNNYSLWSSSLTMSECLLAERRPVPYPEPRPPIAPLWEGPMIPCMSPWLPGIAVEGPTAWFRRTWIASSSLSKRSSIRLCCWLINDVKFDSVWNAWLCYVSKTWVHMHPTLSFQMFPIKIISLK